MKLYKYRALDQRSLSIFASRSLWAASPSSLNDPYECTPLLDPTADVDALFEQLRQDIDTAYSGDPPENRAARIGDLRTRLTADPEGFTKLVWEMYMQRVSRLGIICASEPYDCELMWAHYADGHKGLCIEIDTAFLEGGGAPQFHPVTYSASRSTVRLGSAPEEVRAATALSKSDVWAYEREWRVVLEAPSMDLSLPREVEFPAAAFTGVLIGVHVSDHIASLVKAMAKHLNPQIDVCRMSIGRTDFRLQRSSF